MAKTTMKSAIETILQAHGILEAFQSAESYVVKIESPGYMPLIIEKHGDQRVVAHYFEQNGDLVPDPDLELVDLGGPDWMPVAIQHASGHYMRVAAPGDHGNWKFNLKAAEDLMSFGRMWARNLLAQGFASGALVRAEAG